jgi:peptide/histidine transporter 3/4
MAVSALVESKRLKKAQNSMVPMSALWLFPKLVLVGIGEAFHAPGQLQLFYQEFPVSLRSMATEVIEGIAYYLGTALIDLVQRVTGCLPDDIDRGRLVCTGW